LGWRNRIFFSPSPPARAPGWLAQTINPLRGHWGFQYYLDQAGARALDAKHLRLKSGDTLALPMNNEAFSLNMKDWFCRDFFRFRAALVFDLEHPHWRRILCVILGTAAICRGSDATGNCVRLCLGAGGSGAAQKLMDFSRDYCFTTVTVPLLAS
jgi:hypothetical protein